MKTRYQWIFLYLLLVVFATGTILLIILLGEDYYPWFGILLLSTSIFLLALVFFTDLSLSRASFFYSTSGNQQDVVFRKYAPRKAAMAPAKQVKLYSKCHACEKSTYLPFKCKYCGGEFCTEHRLPENHECSFVHHK